MSLCYLEMCIVKPVFLDVINSLSSQVKIEPGWSCSLIIWIFRSVLDSWFSLHTSHLNLSAITGFLCSLIIKVEETFNWTVIWKNLKDLVTFLKRQDVRHGSSECLPALNIPILERGSTVRLLLLLLLLLLRHAQTTPPGFWNRVNWRALVKDQSPHLAKLRQ